MPKYFFHLRDRSGVLLDHEGLELQGLEQAIERAAHEARSLMSFETLQGRIDLTQSIDIEDEERNMVRRLLFSEAVEIFNGQD